jgi:hypothetical protein
MIATENIWKINSEWDINSGHFKYNYIVGRDSDYCDTSGKKIRKDFINYMNEMYGPPGTRWGFRFDRNFDMISVYFCSQEDAVIFRLTHG